MSWQVSARRNIFVISVGRDSGKIETKIDRVVPLFDDTSYFSFFVRAKLSARVRCNFFASLPTLDSSSFFHFFFDTADRIILVNLRFACWNYVLVHPIISYTWSVLQFQRFFEAIKIVSRYTDGFPYRSLAARMRFYTGCAFREQNYRRLARSITNQLFPRFIKCRCSYAQLSELKYRHEFSLEKMPRASDMYFNKLRNLRVVRRNVPSIVILQTSIRERFSRDKGNGNESKDAEGCSIEVYAYMSIRNFDLQRYSSLLQTLIKSSASPLCPKAGEFPSP